MRGITGSVVGISVGISGINTGSAGIWRDQSVLLEPGSSRDQDLKTTVDPSVGWLRNSCPFPLLVGDDSVLHDDPPRRDEVGFRAGEIGHPGPFRGVGFLRRDWFDQAALDRFSFPVGD